MKFAKDRFEAGSRGRVLLSEGRRIYKGVILILHTVVGRQLQSVFEQVHNGASSSNSLSKSQMLLYGVSGKHARL